MNAIEISIVKLLLLLEHPSITITNNNIISSLIPSLKQFL